MRIVITSILLIALPAFATDKPPAVPTHRQDQAQDQQQAASAEQSQSQGNAQTIESERQAPSTFTVAPSSTAPCVVANGWSVGVPGAGGGRTRAKVDAACWAEYQKQAEHERAQDAATLALAVARFEFEKQQHADRMKVESLRLSECHECEARK